MERDLTARADTKEDMFGQVRVRRKRKYFFSRAAALSTLKRPRVTKLKRGSSLKFKPGLDFKPGQLAAPNWR